MQLSRRLNHQVRFVSIILLCIFALGTRFSTAQAAGSATYKFYCNALAVSGTTDQPKVHARVIVRGSGNPGIGTADVVVTVPGSGLRAFSILLPISPTLTGPQLPHNTTSVLQYIYVESLTSGNVHVNTYVAVGAICSGTISTSLNFTDGRCNQEPYQSVAVYPDNKGGYNFYALFNGVGYFAIHVTEQNLDDSPDTGVTHKIAEAKGVQLFRLAGGGLQVNRMGKDNKMYSYSIGSCGAMED